MAGVALDDFEERYNDAIEAGQRNLRAAKLVSNWCFHAKINRSGGRGLIEAETGFYPSGTWACNAKHSKKNSMHTWLLEDAAYDFYFEQLQELHRKDCCGNSKYHGIHCTARRGGKKLVDRSAKRTKRSA